MEKLTRRSAVAVIAIAVTLLLGSGCSSGGGLTDKGPQTRIDDWNPVPATEADIGQATVQGKATAASAPSAQGLSASAEIGLAAGGAKDVNSFRENIRSDYLPLPTDITYEGLFYDYYFDTGQTEECQQLFCPSYSWAVTSDPFSGEVEYYLSVGLNSGMKESDFQRKKLNLVIVLDISGSMSSSFDSYYYDQFGNRMESPEEDAGKSKMRIATGAVVDLLDHLEDEDRLGMVLFNNDAHLAKPLNLVGKTDMPAIADHILEISAGGGTHFSAGMEMASGLYDELTDVDPTEFESRIIFLTDAMPNLGETSEEGLLGMTRRNADSRVHTTFIGIGVDFNTELIEYITKIRGANYYSVHSSEQFRERMDDEFEYMVTPLVFDLRLILEANGWEIEKVYGSPEASEATGELMKVNTLFPSKKTGGETRGGLILLKLRRTSPDASLTLRATYEDRDGERGGSVATVALPDEAPEFFENLGVRKGVLLSRYADLLKNWMIDEREHIHFSRPWEPTVNDETGIIPPPPSLGRWERQSLPLVVSGPYRELLGEFRRHFEAEMDAVGDDSLNQELDILDTLTGHSVD